MSPTKSMRFQTLVALLAAFAGVFPGVSPGVLEAQVGPEVGSEETRVGSAASIVVKGGQIAQENRVHFGGWAGLVFSERLAIGGGGFALLKNVNLAGPEGETGFDLDMGYGGLMFRIWEPLGGYLTAEMGLLLGAGHAEVRQQLTGTEVGSNNFLVAEGELGIAYGLFRSLHVGASAGYRLTSGVEDLPGVSKGDLNAFTGSLFVRLGGV
ncbi:MAG: hypothetical protein HKO65_18350 [Gemmatimonadetes bacterium]|nr:hypothetical protein [Gemmatimonadota bacterium]NNM07060.1 hypothetical protein [Gemmatimonadota bacterium]